MIRNIFFYAFNFLYCIMYILQSKYVDIVKENKNKNRQKIKNIK